MGGKSQRVLEIVGLDHSGSRGWLREKREKVMKVSSREKIFGDRAIRTVSRCENRGGTYLGKICDSEEAGTTIQKGRKRMNCAIDGHQTS
jgi:hypothetical protein